jgi:hypothetical protein
MSAANVLLLAETSPRLGNAAKNALDVIDCASTRRAGAEGRLMQYSQQNLIVNDRLSKPDGMICPRHILRGGRAGYHKDKVAMPRLVREVEYRRRFLPELHDWALHLFEVQFVRAVLGVIVYEKHLSRNRALLVMLYLKDNMDHVSITRLVFFDTFNLDNQIIDDIDNLILAGGYIAPLTELPCPVIDDSLHVAGMLRPAVWGGYNCSIEVPADALFYGIAGGGIECPNYKFDLRNVLNQVMMVSDIEEVE